MPKIASTVFLLSLFASIAIALPLLLEKASSKQDDIGIKLLKRSRRDDSSCQDHHNCDKWLGNDLYYSCKKDKNRRLCRKSCKLCPTTSPQTQTVMSSTTSTTTKATTTVVAPTGVCLDKNKHCAKWAEDGHCTVNPGYMLYMCPRSCGTCGNTLSTTAANECVDNLPSACPGWISECARNPSVQLHCKKTCNLCITTTPTTITTTSTPKTHTTTTTPSPPTITTTSPKPPITATTSKPPTIATTPKPPITVTTPKPPITVTTPKPPIIATTLKPPTTATTSKPPINATTPKTPTMISTATIISTTTLYETTNKIPTQSTVDPTKPWIISTDDSDASRPSTKRQMDATTKGNNTFENIPSEDPQQVSKLGKTGAIFGIVVSVILVVACVVIAVYLYKRHKKKRNALLPPPQARIISMQPFNDPKSHDTKRDSGIVDCDVYEDPLSSMTNQPFYHVLEESSKKTISTQKPMEPIYACASNGNANEAFITDQPIIYDYSIPERLVSSSLIPPNLRQGGTVNNAGNEMPYYHVLENPNAAAPVIGGITQSPRKTPLAQSRYQEIKHEQSVYESLDKSNRTPYK